MKVWDARDGRQLLALAGAASGAWSPDGKRIAGAGKTLNLWDAETGRTIHTLRGAGSPFTSVAWSPDGRSIVSGASDRTVVIWGADKRQEALSFGDNPARQDGGDRGMVIDSVKGMAWSPDSKRIVSGDYVVGAGTLRVWDAENGKVTRTLQRQPRWAVSGVAWSPDGKRIASATALKVTVWDAEAGREVLSFQSGQPDRPDNFHCVAWSPDGRHIAAGTSDGVKVWDAEKGQPVISLEKQGMSVYSVAWSPDSKRIVSVGSGTSKVWDVGIGKETVSLPLPGTSFARVAWSPDGKRIVAGGGNNTLRVWDAGTGRETLSCEGHTGLVYGVAWSPDGKRIASGGGDGTLKVWDADNGQELLSLKGHSKAISGVAWSPDGKRIASCSHDCTHAIWDASHGQEPLSLTGHARPVKVATFNADDSQILAADDSGKVLAWEARTGLLMPEAPAKMPARPIRTSLPDGRFLRIDGHEVHLVDPEQQKHAARRDREVLASRARFDPDWHRARLVEAEQANNDLAAAFHLDRLLRANPIDPSLHVSMAHLRARQGNWKAAAAAFAYAVGQPGVTTQTRADFLLASAAAGDPNASAAVSPLLDQLAGMKDRKEWYWYLFVAQTIPCAPADAGKMLRITRRELSATRNAVTLMRHGTAHYRAGRFTEAWRTLRGSALAQGAGGYELANLFEALSACRLGRHAEASGLLTRVEAWGAKYAWPNWQQRVNYDLLLREARATIHSPPPTAPLRK
jgi:WD40 repeat protein